MKQSLDKDEYSASASESNEKEFGGLMEQFNKYKELIAKYTSAEYDDSGSHTISKSHE